MNRHAAQLRGIGSFDCEITALQTVPIGDMELFDLFLNCYEKLFQYSHFQCDIFPVCTASVFVLSVRGVMSGRALIYGPYSQFSERKERRGRGAMEASEARDLGS